MAEAAGLSDQSRLTIKLPHELTPSPEWGRDKFLVFDATNDGPYMADVECLFVQDDLEMRVRLGIFPGLLTRLVVPLRYLESQVVIPGRTPHRFKCVCSGGPVDPAKVTSARLAGLMVGGEAAIRISEPQLTDSMPQEWPKAPYPIVGELHQWSERDWPGKALSLEVAGQMLTEEMFSSEFLPADELSPWGGWTQKQFEATGFFRTEHDGQRWWLVDPDGCAFYSVGVDCIRPNCEVDTEGNEDLFLDLPDKEGPLNHLWTSRGDGQRTLFDGMRYNLMRAFGDDWFDKWMELCRQRVTKWGFNTVGNWSHPDFCALAGLPYVMQLLDFPTTEKSIFRDFPDVFSDEYVQNSRHFAGQLAQIGDDPYLVGYFLRNEPHWAFGAYNLAERMLVQAGPSASRDRLVQWLKERHGDVGGLNGAWGTAFPDFETLAAAAVPEDRLTSEAARADLGEFNRMMIEQYARVPSEECKRVDPNHLNLGLRYAWLAHEDLLAGAEVFDVFSINCYADKPDAEVIERCSKAVNAPVLIGEFHTGALDRGLPAGGLRTVVAQRERAESYGYYVEQGAAIPALVGTHYFQWNDQHVVGRHDGENWQIGLVDICQKPYDEIVSAARRSHARIYRVAPGQIPPFYQLPRAIPVE